MAVILFRYILQFSHTSSPTEFEAFAKLSVLNNFAQLGPRKEGPLDSQLCLMLCTCLSASHFTLVVFNFQTSKYQLLIMPDISNMKIVSIILMLKNGAFNTALRKGYKCIGML